MIRIPAALALALALFGPLPSFAQDCPDLAPYIAGQQSRGQIEWLQVAGELIGFQQQCLESSEYFALIGAAWLNGGLLSEAVEALERALLLDAENGAAQIDYAEALYRQGQLFPAIELNEQLLARTDLPANLRPALERRRDEWQAVTRDNFLSRRHPHRLRRQPQWRTRPQPDQPDSLRRECIVDAWRRISGDGRLLL